MKTKRNIFVVFPIWMIEFAQPSADGIIPKLDLTILYFFQKIQNYIMSYLTNSLEMKGEYIDSYDETDCKSILKITCNDSMIIQLSE